MPCAAAARVAGGREPAVGPHLDRRRAAEEEVAAAPADDVVAPRLERVQLGRVEAALAVDVRLVDVDARPLDRLATPQPVAEHVDDDLHDRAAQPHRARAADDEPRPPPAPSTIVGAIMLVSRRPGRARPPAARSYSPSMLFMWMPVPGTTTPEPEPVDAESEAALPAASTTEMCVVPPRRALVHA